MTRTPRSDDKEDLGRVIGRKETRRLKGLENGHRSVWSGLGMFGLIGWSVAVPTLAGIALGLWIDTTWPGRVSWTLTLLFVGVALGCLNAWMWLRRVRVLMPKAQCVRVDPGRVMADVRSTRLSRMGTPGRDSIPR